MLAQHRHRTVPGRNAARAEADALVALIDAPRTDGTALRAALHGCGLSDRGPYQVVAARLAHEDDASAAADALAEALHHDVDRPFTVGRLAGGEAVAVIQGEPAENQSRLRALGPVLQDCLPDAALHGGVGAVAFGPEDLGGGLVQARYALKATRATDPAAARLASADDLTTLHALLAGLPEGVREVYSARTLGPLIEGDGASERMMLHTLEVFLAHNGSWARSAEALHLHVNTVHYRVRRIELLTGRDLSRLDHKLDLQAALMCR